MRDRNALEICFLGWLGASVFPSAAFLTELPPSLESAPILGHAVAVMLVVGCFGSVIGIAIRDLDRSLVTEQFFLAVTGLGCLGYAAALLWAAHLRARLGVPHPYSDSAYILGLCLGFATFTVWRFRQIQRYVIARKLAGEQETVRGTL